MTDKPDWVKEAEAANEAKKKKLEEERRAANEKVKRQYRLRK